MTAINLLECLEAFVKEKTADIMLQICNKRFFKLRTSTFSYCCLYPSTYAGDFRRYLKFV